MKKTLEGDAKTPAKVKKIPEELTEKQALFIMHYLANGFKVQEAALKAGYSEGSAHSIGSQLLENPKIQARIRAVQKNRMARLNADADWVVKELQRVARDAKKAKDFAGQNRALEIIAKIQGLYTDARTAVDANLTVHLNFPPKKPIDVDSLPVIDGDDED